MNQPNTKMTLADAAWRQCLEDSGQMIDVRWLAVGTYGAIRRTVDLSDGSTTYELMPWCGSSRYEPQNGIVEVAFAAGRTITQEQATRLWGECR